MATRGIAAHICAMRRIGKLQRLTLVLVASFLVPLVGTGDALAYDEASAAVVANKGLHFGFGPIVLVPLENRPIGLGLDFDLRYGIGADPAIVGPGGRLAGYFISGRFIGTAMPTGRVTFPLGPVAPFVILGIGAGRLTNPGESGVALLAGGGMMIHLGRVLAFGAEATYQVITGTEFKSFALGPAIILSL